MSTLANIVAETKPSTGADTSPDVLLSAVTAALSTVRDPELDESIVDLGFVTEVALTGGRARIRLRLPTYFCSPNFAYLMVSDAQDAVGTIAGITSVSIVLEEHFAAAEINAGVAAGSGFVGSFGAEANGELDELRRTFQRKAHTACLERACQQLLAAGWTIEGLSGARVRDLPVSSQRDSLLRRRSAIGLSEHADAPIFVDDNGQSIPPALVGRRLRFAQTVRVSMDGNAHFCRGLLATRYPAAAADQRLRQFDQEVSR
jgi:metal-sulfur cluster biosynthetic enzyme